MAASLRLSLLLAAAVLLSVPAASAQKLEYTTVATAGVSMVQVAPSPSTNFLSVRFTLGPCAALQPHVHNGSELAQVMAGAVNLGMINENNELVKVPMTMGTLSQVPVGKIHWYYNPTCDTSVFSGAFDYGTTTQFIFQSIALIPSEALGFFLSGPLPKLASPTPPFATDAKCAARCKQGASSGAWTGRR